MVTLMRVPWAAYARIDPQAISLLVPPVCQSGGNKNKNKWDPKERALVEINRNKGYQLAGGHLISNWTTRSEREAYAQSAIREE